MMIVAKVLKLCLLLSLRSGNHKNATKTTEMFTILP